MQRVLIPSARVLILLLEDLVEDLGDGEGAVAFEQLHGDQKALLPSGMSSERWQHHINTWVIKSDPGVFSWCLDPVI